MPSMTTIVAVMVATAFAGGIVAGGACAWGYWRDEIQALRRQAVELREAEAGHRCAGLLIVGPWRRRRPYDWAANDTERRGTPA